MAGPSGARAQQQQEAADDQQMPHPQTPSRLRTPERNVGQRGRAAAGEFSTQRKAADAGDGYTFNLLPEESLPVTPGVPGSARKRKNTVASSNATMMVVDESPARYSPDQVTEAIMSFADFLRFLEGNQKEHHLMPTIIQRFSELGTVIESQKRHIDRWKQKELDLAISEWQQNLDLIRDLGATIQKQELQLATWQVEKQQWEEKYTLTAQEAQALGEKLQLAARENQRLGEKVQLVARENEHLKRDGSAEIQRLSDQLAQLTRAHADIEQAARERQSAVEALEREGAARQSRVQQLEDERAAMQQTHERLGQQQGQQVAILQTFEQQINELTQACRAQQQRAAALERERDAWQRRHQEQEAATAELETALESERRELGHQSGKLSQAMGEAGRLRAQLEAVKQDYEEKLETARRVSADQQAAESMEAMQQLEEKFLSDKTRETDQLNRDIYELRRENQALHVELASATESLKRSGDEINRLMANQQQQVGRPEDVEEIHRLQGELNEVSNDNEDLRRALKEKEELYQEDLRVQASEYEVYHNKRLADVNRKLADVTEEKDQLVADLQRFEEVAAELHHSKQFATELQQLVEALQAEAASKDQEVSEFQLRDATQQETIRSLYTEKEELTRNLATLAAKKANTELQASAAARERDQLQATVARLDSDKRELETKLHDLMKEATETLQSHQQHATLSNQDARAQVEKLSADLRQRDEQMRRGQQQLRELQTTVRSLESRGRQLERDLESANGWTARLRTDVEALQSEKRALESGRVADQNANLLDHQRAVDELTARYEQSKQELWDRVVEEENRASELRAQLSAEDEYHQGQMQAAQTALDQAHERTRELEQENQVLSSDNAAQRRILEEAARLEVRHQELKRAYEHIQSDSATTIAELEEHAANLQAALEREQQLVQQLQSQSRGGLHQQAEHAKALHALRAQARELEQANSQLRLQGRELELVNSQLQRQMQTAEEQRVAKEQGSVHEKLQRERELRALQGRYEALESESAGLRRALAQQTQQNEEWGRVLGERGDAVEQAQRSAEDRAAAALSKVEHEFGVRRRELEAQVDELVQSSEALGAEKQHLESELHKADEALAALRSASEERGCELLAKDDEIERLQRSQNSREQELSRRGAELEAFERELLQQAEKKDEIIEALHQVSEEQLEQLEDKDNELRALSRANSDHMRQLAAKDEELDAARRELRRKQSEAESLAMENEEQFTKLQALELRQARRSERLGDYERLESALAGKLAALQKKFEQVAARERELTTEVAALRAEKLETKTTITRELRKLDMVADGAGAAWPSETESSSHRDLLRVFELAQSYQAKQVRQDALVRSKEAQVADLSAQVKQLKAAAVAHASEPQHRDSDAGELEQEVGRLSDEVARLKVENRRLLRETRAGESDAASRRIVAEWERNYPALKARVQELIEENAELKERQLAAGSDQHLADEIDALSSLLRRRDAEIEELRRHEAPRFNTSRSQGRSASHSNSNTPRSSDAQRMKKLMELVELKEKKILVQNDHMTELMAQAVKLQYEIQCYQAEFGELKLKSRGVSARANPARVS